MTQKLVFFDIDNTIWDANKNIPESTKEAVAALKRNGNKAVIDKWLEGHPYLKQYAEAHGTTYLIHYDIDMSATDFGDQLIDEKGTVICQGDCFEMPHTFRITLSHAEDLEEGPRRIDEFLEEKAAIYGRLSEK